MRCGLPSRSCPVGLSGKEPAAVHPLAPRPALLGVTSVTASLMTFPAANVCACLGAGSAYLARTRRIQSRPGPFHHGNREPRSTPKARNRAERPGKSRSPSAAPLQTKRHPGDTARVGMRKSASGGGGGGNRGRSEGAPSATPHVLLDESRCGFSGRKGSGLAAAASRGSFPEEVRPKAFPTKAGSPDGWRPAPVRP